MKLLKRGLSLILFTASLSTQTFAQEYPKYIVTANGSYYEVTEQVEAQVFEFAETVKNRVIRLGKENPTEFYIKFGINSTLNDVRYLSEEQRLKYLSTYIEYLYEEAYTLALENALKRYAVEVNENYLCEKGVMNIYEAFDPDSEDFFESDFHYYALVESLRNNKAVYTFEKNEDLIFSIPKGVNTARVAYPTLYTQDAEITFKVYVLPDGTVANVNLVNTFKAFQESNKLPQEHIDSAVSALLNTTFEVGTPNQFNVTYSHSSPRPNQL